MGRTLVRVTVRLPRAGEVQALALSAGVHAVALSLLLAAGGKATFGGAPRPVVPVRLAARPAPPA
ncbi:MAG: hypothetical protein D6718_10780, partial [Acidobacteria bacterium]